MVKQRKIEWVEDLTEQIQESANMLFTDFSGINVQDIEDLRGSLRESNSSYRVIKNRLARLAFEKAEGEIEEDQPAVEQAENAAGQPALEDLPGVGAAKVLALQEEGFENSGQIASAKPEELMEVSGIGEALAQKLINAATEIVPEQKTADSGADVEQVAGGLIEKADPFLSGNTAIAFNRKNIVGAARAIVDFSEENEALEIKGGLLEDRLLSVEDIIELSKLPSRRELLTMTAIGLKAPVQKLARYLVNPLQKLVWVVDKVKQKKEDSKE